MVLTPTEQVRATSPSRRGSTATADDAGRRRWHHLPALDGLRGVAVLAVMLFHGGVSWLPGGFLGVDVFFVLSGFLITSLLIEERDRTGTIGLGGFWSRRARRLLPALFLLLAGTAAFAHFVAAPESLGRIRGDVMATLAYFANWHFIASQSSYFARTGDPSPLAHTWSLAIEEQFYVVWPLVVLAVARGRRALVNLGVVAGAGLAASAIAMAVVYHPGSDPSRSYYGTDTRSHVLMAGALLAVIVAALNRSQAGLKGPATAGDGPATPAGEVSAVPAGPIRWGWLRTDLVDQVAAGTAALVAAGAVGVAMVRTQGTDSWVYRGGLVEVAGAVAVVIAAIVLAPRSPVPLVLSFAPLRLVGRISYGMYLFHWPLYLVLDHARTGLLGWRLLAVRMGATTVVALVSYYLIEQPVRRGLLRRWRAAAALPVAAGATVAATVAATTIPAAALAGTAGPARGAAAATTTTSTTVAAAPVIRRPALAPGQRVKVMVMGDSVAETLAVGLQTYARQDGITLDNEGILGCGIVQGGPYDYFGGRFQQPRQCDSWPERWSSLVDSHDPDVVFLVVGRWEVMDRVFNGVWTHLGDPAFDAYIASELDHAVQVLSARGAVVAVATAPYYLRGERPDGGRWPEDDPARVDRFNAIVRSVAARHPHTVTVVDLGGHTSVGGRYTPYVDGIEMRYDGVHFTPVADRWLAPWLLPQLLAVAPPHTGGASGASSSSSSSSSTTTSSGAGPSRG
ncbi:MAG TPA: acyltransferase family protein [Acidimicrobiales bacterium]|nr:acyltransferase family protein [Acidimicrobiales bacterium]